MAAIGREIKTARIDLRLSETQKAILEQAAELLGRNLSDFVISASTDAAQIALADQRSLTLPEKDMNAFLTDLEREPRSVEGLRDLFARPSVFKQ